MSKLLSSAGYTQGKHDPNAGLIPDVRGGRHHLVTHLDPRGGLVELWRESWDLALKGAPSIGLCQQAYISITSPGIVKGWHCHAIQTDRFIVLRGRILLCTYNLYLPDDGVYERDVYERVLDSQCPERIDVPPMTAHGWLALGNEDAWVLNLVSHEYNGTDEWRLPANNGPWKGDTPYDWHQNRDG